MSRRCTATRRDGSPCRAWAVRGSDPPRCAAHGGTHQGVVGPERQPSPLKHAHYAQTKLPEDCTIDAVIENLYQRQKALDDYLDAMWDERADVQQLARLLRIHGQNASRLGRLLRDRRALSGDAADGIAGAFGQALDELSTELGIEL